MIWNKPLSPESRATLLALALLLGQVAAAQDLPPIPELDGAVGQAARPLLETLRKAPDQAESAGDLAMLLHAHEMLEWARPWYRLARRLAPDQARWWYLGALADEASGDTQAAHEGYRRSLELAPGEQAAAVRLARLLRLAGDRSGARELLERVTDPESPAVMAELAQLALAQGDWARAAEWLEAALAAQPQARSLYHPLALALRNGGDVAAARAALEMAGPGAPRMADPWHDDMQRRSQSAAFFMSQGLTASRNGDYPAALALLQRAASLEPDNALVAVNLARAQESNGLLADAEATLNALLGRQPDHAPAHFNLGVLDELRNNDSAALDHYRQAIALDPAQFQVTLLAANAALRLRRFELASALYAQALTLRPERDELRFRRVVSLAAGSCRAAVDEALALVKRLPEDLEVLTLYIRVVATCPDAADRHRENALNAGRNLYRLNPAWPVAVTRAMAEAANGHFDQAEQLQLAALMQAGAALDSELRSQLESDLSAYRQGKPATDAFATSPQVSAPRRLTAADRR